MAGRVKLHPLWRDSLHDWNRDPLGDPCLRAWSRRPEHSTCSQITVGFRTVVAWDRFRVHLIICVLQILWIAIILLSISIWESRG
jgi:hypothetical protein